MKIRNPNHSKIEEKIPSVVNQHGWQWEIPIFYVGNTSSHCSHVPASYVSLPECNRSIWGFKISTASWIYGCFLTWWYPQNTSKWSFLVGKPMGLLGKPIILGNPHIGQPRTRILHHHTPGRHETCWGLGIPQLLHPPKFWPKNDAIFWSRRSIHLPRKTIILGPSSR